MRSGGGERCLESVDLVVVLEVELPELVQLDGVIVLQYAQIDVSELGA